jgi:hypothetical protein
VRVLDLAIVRTLDRDRDGDLGLARVRDLALDLAIHLVLARKTGGARMVVIAYGLLVAVWTPTISWKFTMGEILEYFDAFLSNSLAKISQTAPTLPEDIDESIQRAGALLETACKGPITPQDRALGELASRIAGDVHDLVEPILARTAPYCQSTISCARIGLLAIAAVDIHLHGRGGVEKESASPLLHAAFNGLTALQQRVDGELIPSEVLVLARA